MHVSGTHTSQALQALNKNANPGQLMAESQQQAPPQRIQQDPPFAGPNYGHMPPHFGNGHHPQPPHVVPNGANGTTTNGDHGAGPPRAPEDHGDPTNRHQMANSRLKSLIQNRQNSKGSQPGASADYSTPGSQPKLDANYTSTFIISAAKSLGDAAVD